MGQQLRLACPSADYSMKVYGGVCKSFAVRLGSSHFSSISYVVCAAQVSNAVYRNALCRFHEMHCRWSRCRSRLTCCDGAADMICCKLTLPSQKRTNSCMAVLCILGSQKENLRRCPHDYHFGGKGIQCKWAIISAWYCKLNGSVL